MVPSKVDSFFDDPNPDSLKITPPVDLSQPPPSTDPTPPANNTPPANSTPPANNVPVNNDPPPANNTPPADNQPPPANNTPAEVKVEELWFKKHLGVDDEKTALEKLELVKNFDPTPKYNSDNIRKMDMLAGLVGKDDPKTLQFYQTEIKDDMSLEDKINLTVEKMILDNPDYAEVKQALVGEFMEKLGLDVKEEDKANLSPADQLKYKRNAVEFNEKVNGITKEIKEIQGKLNSGGKTPEEIAADALKVEANKTAWAAEEQNMLKDLKIRIPDWEDDGKGGIKQLDNMLKDFNFADKESQETFSTYFNHYVKAMGYPEMTPQVKAEADSYAFAGLIKDRLPYMIKETISFARSEYNKELVAKGVNPSILKVNEQIPAGNNNTGGSLVDKFFDGQ